jgi:hypothetical protein
MGRRRRRSVGKSFCEPPDRPCSPAGSPDPLAEGQVVRHDQHTRPLEERPRFNELDQQSIGAATTGMPDRQPWANPCRRRCTRIGRAVQDHLCLDAGRHRGREAREQAVERPWARVTGPGVENVVAVDEESRHVAPGITVAPHLATAHSVTAAHRRTSASGSPRAPGMPGPGHPTMGP